MKVLSGLTALTVLAMGRVLCCGFVSYDDPLYVTDNTFVRQGLTWESWNWAWSADVRTGNWHPLTWLSLMLDVQLFGVRPLGHHAINLLLHVICVACLYMSLSRMTGRRFQSAWVAAIFGVHPVHVESVAWISERKDVLSGLFWVGGMLAYSRYVNARSTRAAVNAYLVVTLMLVLGLLSKPMVVTFPFALLLLDFWPLRRIRLKTEDVTLIGTNRPGDVSGDTETTAGHLGCKVVTCLLEKLPWMVLSAVMCLVAVRAQGPSVVSLSELSHFDRLLHTPVAYVMYLSKTVWPTNLAVFYPREDFRCSPTIGALSFSLLVAITIWCWRTRNLFPARLVGWLWFLGTLVPVIGIVQVGHQAFADRYLYLPQIGLLIMVSFGLFPPKPATRQHNSVDVGRQPLSLGMRGVALAIIPVLLGMSFVQIGHWCDSVRLYQHGIAVTRANWLCHFNLGTILSDHGQHAAAIEHYQSVLRYRPDHPKVHNNLGVSLAASGRCDQAIAAFRMGLAIHPWHYGMRMNLGNALARSDRCQEAAEQYATARQLNPNDLQLLHNLALCQANSGMTNAAIRTAREALSAFPARNDKPHFRRSLQERLAEWERLDK